jgi:hypothetical protein
MSEPEELWIPLVDEPIGGIVTRLEAEDPELHDRVGSPRRLLAFRTFAYIRVGIVLGQLLFEDEIEPYDGSEAWVERLLGNPAHREALVRELHTTADEIVGDPRYADDEPLGPDEGARARFREFARKRLGSA